MTMPLWPLVSRSIASAPSSTLTLTFFWKSKVWLITSINFSNTSFVDGWLTLLMATLATLSNSVKLLILLWSLPSAVCRMTGVSDITAGQRCYGLTGALLHANDQLIGDVQSAGFLLCLRSRGDGREDGFAGRHQELVCLFLYPFDHRSGHDGNS